jgi:hypothetical protein
MLVCAPILLACAAVFFQGGSPASGCGVKFLSIGRTVRLNRAHTPTYPASIIVFAQPQRGAARAIRDPRLHAQLRAAGHRLQLVEDDLALAKALESPRVDLVLTDTADADRVVALAAASPSKPTVLPVMYEPTREETRRLEERCQCRLKSADGPDRYLATIDDAMKSRTDRKKRIP